MLVSLQINASRAISVFKVVKHEKSWPKVLLRKKIQPQVATSVENRFSVSNVAQPMSETNGESSKERIAPGRKMFVDYSIYKGKSALCIKPIKPTFKPLEADSFALQREGSLLLEFAPASGMRVYDWGQKKTFALSVAELGSIVSMAPNDQTEFFHDPNKGKQGMEGLVTKTLKISPMKDGFFFNLAVREKGKEDKVSVPVSRAEFVILRNTMNFLLPYLMGWSAFVDPATIEIDMIEQVSNGNSN